MNTLPSTTEPAPRLPAPLPPSRALRALGWVLMTASVGLVSCTSMFFL